MLGVEPWPNEGEVESALGGFAKTSTNAAAWEMEVLGFLDGTSPPEDAVRALLLARRAVSSASREKVASYRDTLARALFRLGRFDEALVEQRRALVEASSERQPDFRRYLQRLESDIAAWRDESGALRRVEGTARLDALTREISKLEQDPDVRLWLGPARQNGAR